MIIFGILSLIAGVVCALYGNTLNNDLETQLESILSNGVSNPGNVYLYIGIAVAVLGLVLLVAGVMKKEQ